MLDGAGGLPIAGTMALTLWAASVMLIATRIVGARCHPGGG
jgi:hypothetical protein